MQKSRVSSMLFALGCLTVLGTTFGVGVVVGRHSGRPLLPPSGDSTKLARRDESALPPTPTLTFYRELTAPLEEPRPKTGAPPRTGRSGSREGAGSGHEPSLSGGPTFAVQVGAYKSRAPAEALRATLAASGHDAYVEEVAGPSGTRYRVRVGSFASRQAADEAAARLARERRLATYVSPR